MNQQKAAMFADPGGPEAAAHRAAIAAKYPQSYWDNMMAQRANPQAGFTPPPAPGGMFAPPPAAGAPVPSNVVPRTAPPFRQMFSPGALANPGGNAMRGGGRGF